MNGKPASPYALHKNKQGYAATLAVLILSTFLTVVLIQLAFSSLSYLERSQIQKDKRTVRFYAEICIQEGLLRYSRDETAGDIDLFFSDPLATCTIDIDTAYGGWFSSETLVSTTARWGDYIYPLRVIVDENDMELVLWEE